MYSNYYYEDYSWRQDLTGVWAGDEGGTYYIRQIGSEITWYGENAPINPGWSNVASGNIVGDQIFLKWMDVPKGTNMLSGKLIIRVSLPDTLIITKKTGGFGGNSFERVI